MILDPKIVVYHDHLFKSTRGSYLRSKGYALNHVLVMRATYGQLVSGSGQPAMAPLSAIVKEALLINAVKTYRHDYSRASEEGIRISLLEFIVIRLLSTKLGQLVGIIKGATKHGVSFLDIPDLHRKIETSPERKAIGIALLS